jgi:hypothetical protein
MMAGGDLAAEIYHIKRTPEDPAELERGAKQPDRPSTRSAERDPPQGT